ncbi:FIST C-terminal domain-containing protein [Dechloromonas sp. XY25]|uniref:FIST C-terminal domain-containing protein n=1 Tax=Dechloromonas hankyongensis TaxID=2908002 RepID=A0ABS9K1J2_9RHOO|nr:FIST C-terminal domain-containing protein [Dechloromonas hankyongensis]MCG2577042.1 FIST C-terminal domain-containing protein [Dechloromonas hankyongensis]
MKAASSLVTGPRPVAELAQEAIRQALANAGVTRADHVLLFLSRDYARNPRPAVIAAARAAGCLSVCGSTASGLFTERGWQLDQAAAAAMILASRESTEGADEALLSFSSHGRLPFDWQADTRRAGFLDSDGVTWAHGRVTDSGCAELRLPGVRSHLAISTGLRLLGDPQTVDQCRGYELGRVGGHRAIDSLYRALPAELRQYPPLHQIALVRHPDEPGIAILSANGDGSLMLADSLENGDSITWAIRQPLTAEQQTRKSLDSLALTNPHPDFALMFSCIGRGPLFYGDDDRDLQVFREVFPDTPLLGAYGTGQIIPAAGNNRLYHNAVLTLLFESSHV